MNKRHLHHLWTKFRIVKPWYFLAILLVSATVCVFAMRANNQKMIELREAVYVADQKNGDVEGALQELRAYVVSHMNTNLSSGRDPVYPPIQLKFTYERLVEKRAKASSNETVYANAQKYCERENSSGFYGATRIPCIEKYVKENGGKQLPPIPDALYKFDFISPSWSPDLAGWSLLVVYISTVLFILSLALRLWFKHKPF